jgi:hypothetical protein
MVIADTSVFLSEHRAPASFPYLSEIGITYIMLVNQKFSLAIYL